MYKYIKIYLDIFKSIHINRYVSLLNKMSLFSCEAFCAFCRPGQGSPGPEAVVHQLLQRLTRAERQEAIRRLDVKSHGKSMKR